MDRPTRLKTSIRNLRLEEKELDGILTEMEASSDIECMSDGDDEHDLFPFGIKPNELDDDTDEDPTFEPNDVDPSFGRLNLENQSIEEDDDVQPCTSSGLIKKNGGPLKTYSSKNRKKTSSDVTGKENNSKKDNGKKKKGGKKKVVLPRWHNKVFNPENITLHSPAYKEEDTSGWEQFTYVKQYLSDSLFDLISSKSNQNYVFRTGKSLNLTVPELKVWFGINFVMSALEFPKIRMYWQNKWRVPLIADAMTRDRFFLLRRSIKLVFDNEISNEVKAKDRLWKIRPLVDVILSVCEKHPRSQNISVDEMMIPFSGACAFRQYVPSKPNPLGLKAFVLANPNGIVCDFIIYQGPTTFPENLKSKYGLGECAVLLLTRSLVPGHVLYVDRYFTTLRLADALLERGIRMTGTIVKKRIPEEAVLKTDKELVKVGGRGSCNVIVRPDDKMALTQWLDNKGVTMISTNEAQNPETEVKRWSKLEKKYITVKQPKVINSYNVNMGGVDLADRMIAYCPSRARTKKWTIRVILHMCDLAISNAWLQFREEQLKLQVPKHKISQLRTYKLEYGESLIESSINFPSLYTSDDDDFEIEQPDNHEKSKKKVPTPIPCKKRRRCGAIHLPKMSEKQNRCREDKCKKKTNIYCTRCSLHLCLTAKRNCFVQFHS